MFTIKKVHKFGLEYFVIQHGSTVLHMCMGLPGAVAWVRRQEQKIVRETAKGGVL